MKDLLQKDIKDIIRTLASKLKGSGGDKKERPEDGHSNKAVSLTRGQKLITIGFSLFIFIVSTAAFFPLDALIQYQLRQMGEKARLFIIYDNLDLSFFGESSVQGLEVHLKDGTVIKIAKATTDASVFDLVSGHLDGEFNFENIHMPLEDGGDLRLNASLELDLQIETVKKSTLYTGDISMQLSQLVLPPFTIPIAKNMGMVFETKSTVINSVVLKAKGKKNQFNIEKLDIKSSILLANITGTIKLSNRLMSSNVNLHICPKPTEKFYADYEIANTFIKPKADKLCELTVIGPLSKPQTNAKELLMPDNLIMP